MKTKIRTVMLSVAGALAISASAHAATVTGSGCNTFGTVSYAYINPGTSLLIINGGACVAYNLTDGEVAALAAVASEGLASGKRVVVSTGAAAGGGAPNSLTVAITP